jgi:hypothetical protein
MGTTQNTNGPATGGPGSEREALPVRSLADARRWLAAPFPGVCVGYLPNKLGANSQWAAVFPYVDVTAIQDRLDRVVGPDGWTHSVAEVDDKTLAVTMRVLGTEHSEVGQGSDRWSQSANALKRCARHFGIGRYLTQLPIVRLKLNQQIPINRNGSPYITDQLLDQLRATYERQVSQLEGRFGAVLPHPGVGAGEHEGEAPTHPEVDPDAGSSGDASLHTVPVRDDANAASDAPAANPHGERLRNTAATRGVSDADLANMTRNAVGQGPIPSERARAALPTMLNRISEQIAERTLELLDTFHPADATAPEPASGGVTSVDFGELEPPQAA